MYYKVKFRSNKNTRVLFDVVVKKNDPIKAMNVGKIKARTRGFKFDKQKHYITFRPMTTTEIKEYIARRNG